MRIKHRLSRLEEKLGNEHSKHYLTVFGEPGESPEDAIARAAKDAGLKMEQIGKVWFWGEEYAKEIDFGGYQNVEDLIGFEEDRRLWREAMEGAE
jgi:hypothetical protein